MSDSSQRPFIIPVFLPNAGCPYRCVFCDQSIITGKTPSSQTTEEYRAAIRSFLAYKGSNNRYTQISFYGGNFLGLPEKSIVSLLNEATRFVADGAVDSIRFSTRPDSISEKTLEILKGYPISTIELGVQSMNDEVLHKSNRGHSASDTEKAVDLLKKNSYEIGLQMMTGLPDEDENSALYTARQIIGLAPDFVRIYPTIVLADTVLALWFEKGLYTPMTLASCVTLVKKIYRMFDDRHIPVGRMGLQASDILGNSEKIVAGPYHPAFGHLVLSELFLDKAIAALSTTENLPDAVTLHVHPINTSRLRGLKNQNVRQLKKIFSLTALKIIPDISLDIKDLVVSGL